VQSAEFGAWLLSAENFRRCRNTALQNYLPFTTRYSPFATHHSLSFNQSPIAIRRSLFATRHSLLAVVSARQEPRPPTLTSFRPSSHAPRPVKSRCL